MPLITSAAPGTRLLNTAVLAGGQPPPTITADPTSIATGVAITVGLTGTNTAWSTTSTTQFSLSGGSGASIVSQTASSATTALLVIQPGIAAGTLTITGPSGEAVTLAAAPVLGLFTTANSSSPGTPSQPFTLAINGTPSSATMLTFGDGGAGGTFTPSRVTLPATNGVTGTFTYTPSSTAGPRLVALMVMTSGGVSTAQTLLYLVN